MQHDPEHDGHDDVDGIDAVDDELFPPCTPERAGTTYTDEYGVTYVCDLVDELGYSWVALGPSTRPDPRPE